MDPTHHLGEKSKDGKVSVSKPVQASGADAAPSKASCLRVKGILFYVGINLYDIRNKIFNA